MGIGRKHHKLNKHTMCMCIHNIMTCPGNFHTSDNQTKPKSYTYTIHMYNNKQTQKPRRATLWYTKATKRHHDVVFK